MPPVDHNIYISREKTMQRALNERSVDLQYPSPSRRDSEAEVT